MVFVVVVAVVIVSDTSESNWNKILLISYVQLLAISVVAITAATR